MITDVLLANPWLSPAALVVLVVVGPWVAGRIVARTGLARALTAISLLPVGALTLVPVHRELYARCTVQWSLPTPGRVELFADVVLFVAPALLGGVASRRPVAALPTGTLLPASLEVARALAPQLVRHQRLVVQQRGGRHRRRGRLRVPRRRGPQGSPSRTG